MSKSGLVTAWKRSFGFVECDGDERVYIHTSEIDGGRLRVGLEVKFDVEEGKDGKLRGVNVSGPAVLAKGADLTEEEIESDRGMVKEARDAAAKRNSKELEDAWAMVQKVSKKNQSIILKKLMKALDVEKAEEKRTDPTGTTREGRTPKQYTRGEFIAFYGQVNGQMMWDKAAPKGAKKVKKGKTEKDTKKRITTE